MFDSGFGILRVARYTERKEPYYFTPSDGASLTIAGLWDEWKDSETGEPLRSCTMIITAANDFVSPLHDRMPVLLQESNFDSWLDGSAGLELLKPAANDYLQAQPVSTRVNSSRAPDDYPTLIDRLEADPMPTDDPEALIEWGKRNIQSD